ncbi:hypothetical protein [Streptomyces sp. NPDC057412]|uniref:hypothetical protein n=1 Tax=Streptomyces sp. NPDC057412 TaxID=3346123 RepID=UPI0036742BCC
MRVSEAGVGTSLGFGVSGVLWRSGVVGPESGVWGAEGVGCPLGVVVVWWIGTGVTCACCWWFGVFAGGCWVCGGWVWGPGWFGVLPVGCWGGRDGVVLVLPGWFGVPGVP